MESCIFEVLLGWKSCILSIRGEIYDTEKAQNAVKDWIDNGKDAFLITGARQIGKTYLIRQCLKESGIPYIELNFIEQPELVELFQGAKDVKEILMRLSLVVKEPLKKGKTILFLDEIQEFKDIVTRIKFLVEEGSFRYIMSGSLLGVELNDLRSAPVGICGFMTCIRWILKNLHRRQVFMTGHLSSYIRILKNVRRLMNLYMLKC